MFALTSAMMSAAAAVAEKKALFKTDAFEFSVVLAVLNMFFALPFLYFVDYTKVTAVTLGVLFFKSILNALAFYCVMSALKRLEISKSLPMMVLTPGLVAFFAFVFLGEALNRPEIIGLLLLLAGTYVLQLKEKQKVFDPFTIFVKSKGHNYILYALSIFTATSLLDKALLSKFNVPPNAFMGFQHIFLAIIFTVWMFAAKKKIPDVKKHVKGSFKWILLIAVLTIGYRYTQILAIKPGKVALVLAIKRISVFIAMVIGGRIFKEKDLLRKTVATIIMILGAVLVIVPDPLSILKIL